jgi:pseudo-response regulator 7
MNHFINKLRYEINSSNNQWHSLTWINTLSQSSDSGSESGTNTRKFAKSRSICAYDNNSGSNDENDYGSRGLSTRDGSDKGSGTQVLHRSHMCRFLSIKPVRYRTPYKANSIAISCVNIIVYSCVWVSKSKCHNCLLVLSVV